MLHVLQSDTHDFASVAPGIFCSLASLQRLE